MYVNFADEQCTCRIWCFKKHYSDSPPSPNVAWRGSDVQAVYFRDLLVQVTRVMLWKGLWGLHRQELVRHQTWTCCLHDQLLSHNSPNTENEAAKRSQAPGKSWAKRLCQVVFALTSLMVWPYADGNAAVQAADVNSSSGVLLDTDWARYSHSHCRQVCPCRHKSKTWKWRNSKTLVEQTVQNKLMIWIDLMYPN